MITREFKLYLNAGVGVAPVINANQFDQDEEWIFTLLQSDGTVYTPSTGAIIGLKQDGTTILNAGTVNEDGQVVITETEQMTAVPGSNLFEILIDGNTHGTANFVVFVERRPGDIDNPSESDISLFQEAIEAAGNVTQFQADISALQSGLATTNANLTSEANTRASADATLQSNISAEASTRQTQDAVLQAEIDQIIAPTGEAPSAAEVQNARIGVDGTTYDTLGNAIRGQVSDLKNAILNELLNANAYDIIAFSSPISWTHNGVTFTWNNGKCDINGTATATSFDTIYHNLNGFPIGMKAGGTYRLKYSSANVLLQVLVNKNGAFDSVLVSSKADINFTIPNDASGVTIRLAVQSGISANENVEPILFTDVMTNKELTNNALYQKSPLPNGTDFNDIYDTGVYGITSSYTFDNNPLPTGYGGTLICFNPYAGMTLQVVFDITTNTSMYARTSIGGAWRYPWTKINGYEVTNNYTSQHYENTYNITSTPTITADTNNYLASTNDQTDRTADIQAMLAQNGVCHLGPGLFMVSGVDIPDYKSVIGSGKYTTVRLLPSVTTGYVFKLNNQSSVSDVRISGGTSAPTLSSTVGTRHGILFEGTKISGQTGGVTKKKSSVFNVIISNCNGGGITCNGTGVDLDSNIMVDNCFIDHCNAGIYIPYYSEFHRFTNCSVTYCYYGCVNNGGNNTFTNCDFSGNRTGILIDNASDQSPNNSHGTYTGCTVNHSYSDSGVINQGTAIDLRKANNGEIFNAMQIHYGKVLIDDSVAIRFSNCQFGRGIAMTVTDSTTVTFNGCSMYSASEDTLTQSNNTRLKFVECYTYSGNVYNPVA